MRTSTKHYKEMNKAPALLIPPPYLQKFYDKDGKLIRESISYHGNIHYAKGVCQWIMTIPPNKHYHSFTVKRIGRKGLAEFHKRKTQPELFQ